MTPKKLSLAAMLAALCAVGAAIKIPAVVGSVALDSFPALVAAAMLGGPAGAAAGGLGHLLSAFLVGMPLGFLHIFIAIEMAFLVYVFGYFYNRGNGMMAGALFIAGTSVAAPAPFIFIISKAFYLAVVPSLLLGSMLNTVLALLIIPRLARMIVWKKSREKEKEDVK